MIGPTPPVRCRWETALNLRSTPAPSPLLLLPLLLAACQPGTPSGSGSDRAAPAPSTPPGQTEAPAPPAVPHADAGNAPIERAAPPTVRAVALGRFEAHNDFAKSATGTVELGEDEVTGANGATFVTERVAIVRGGDEFTAGQRYADVMMMDADEPVELRRVVDETVPAGGRTFCNGMKTGFLAIASYGYAQDAHTLVKIIGLQGDGLPAATAKDTSLCGLAIYQSKS